MKQSFLVILALLTTYASWAQPTVGVDTNAVDYSTPIEYEFGGWEPVRGVQTLDHNSLMRRAGIDIGDKITIPGDATQKAVKNLWNLGLFSDVRLYIHKIIPGDPDIVILRFDLQELPRLSPGYRFFGLKKSEEDDIREKWKIQVGAPFTEHDENNIKSTIKDHFFEKGFLRTKVDVIKTRDTTAVNHVKIEIKVDKGYKVKINDIFFEGNENVSEQKLQKQMKGTKEKSRFALFGGKDKLVKKEDFKPKNLANALGNISIANTRKLFGDRIRLKIFSSSKFKEDEYKTDKNALLDYYNSLGYRDATITFDTTYFVDDKNLNVEIKVEEGIQYYFRNITWKGNSKFSDGRLDTLLGIKKGDIYNKALLDQRLQFDPNGTDITSFYMDDGYLFFSITPVEVAVVGDSIDLEIRIYEGPQATIRDVIISGNTKTNEHVIRRELRTLPGDKFSRSALIRSQREIANLGFFDPEAIGINPIPNPEDGTVDIEYSVVEKPSDQLELSAGWGGSGTGVVGSIGVSFNNFSVRNMFKKGEWTPLPSGDGQKLSFRAQTNGRFYQSYNVSFTEPWFGGKKPNSFTVSFYKSLLSNGVRKNDTENDRQLFVTNGGSVSYGIRLKWPDDYFTLLSTVNFQNFNLQDWTRNDFIIETGKVYNFSIKETLARNSLDKPLYPTSGSNISLSLQLTPPYSIGRDVSGETPEEKFKWIEYHKWRFNAEWFTPIVGNLVFRASAKFGFLGHYNNDIGTAPFERFQVGGDGLSNFTFYGTDIISLRGYEAFTNTDGSVRSDPIFNKFTLELRYPLSLNPSSTVYALLFAEGGNSWDNFGDYNPLDLKRSVGIGIRAFLPMFGLLGVDYGIRFDDNLPGDLQEANGFFDYILKNGKFSIILGFEPE